MKKIGFIAFALIAFTGITTLYAQQKSNPYYSHTDNKPVRVSDDQWKKILAPQVYEIGRGKGTEPPYHNAYWDNHKAGTYYCAVCGEPLFSSNTKFDSHTGWPSFTLPISNGSVKTDADNSVGMERTEVVCARCGSHLGHLFNDGPAPTHNRYCMNSGVMNFVAK